MDEVAITEGNIYDPADGTYLGHVTLSNTVNTSEIANIAVVFMVAGISSRWKQTVGFHFTNKSTDGQL